MLGTSAGRRAVLVDGVVQSVDPGDAIGGYWEAMVPSEPPRRALVLGLGAGTLVLLLLQRFGPLLVVGVDDSTEMMRLAREEFGLADGRVEIVNGDAFAYVHNCEQRFDFIAVDLYRANRLARGVLALPFLRLLAARLEPRGSVAYNLFRDDQLAARVGRLKRVFEPDRLVDVAANTIVHARPRRQR